MKTLRLLLILLLTGFQSFAQPFSIGSTTITFTDPSRSNRAIDTDIYYPAIAAGSNFPVAPGLFPVIAFGHGFVMSVSAYQNIWSVLVPKGYIVALPKTEGGILPNHSNFGCDLAFVISALQQSGSTSGSLFNGKIATESAVIGHSMGGGAAMLSVQYNASITAVAGLAPAETNPSASAAAQQITLPSMILAGGNDCVTPAAQHSRLIYDNLNSGCKWYLSINGGSHCQFANQNFNCTLGEATCSPSPAISSTIQQAIAAEYLLPWLNFELKNECDPWIMKQSMIAGDVRITSLSSCQTLSLCPSPGSRKITNLKSTSVQFNWAPSSCSQSYEIRFRKNGASFWSKKTTSVNSRSVYNLTPGTGYEWQVRSVCDSITTFRSSWGTLRYFTTASIRTGDQLPETTVLTLNIYPNPGDGLFHIRGDGADGESTELSILNTLGQRVFTQTITNRDGELMSVIDLSSYPKGLYFLQVITSKHAFAKQLILQ